MFKRLTGRTSPEERFWTWFTQNSNVLLKTEDFQGLPFSRLTEELGRIESGLVWELGIHEGGRDLIISADGNRSLFPAVQKLVAAAPRIEGWRIIAFRPRKSLELTLQIGELALKAENLAYDMRRGEPGKVNIDVFIDNLKKDDRRFMQLGFVFLDAALGEYDMETKVAEIKFDSRELAPPEKNLRPFRNLPSEFDSYFEKTPEARLG